MSLFDVVIAVQFSTKSLPLVPVFSFVDDQIEDVDRLLDDGRRRAPEAMLQSASCGGTNVKRKNRRIVGQTCH